MTTPMTSESVNGRNTRVVVVVPSRWAPATSDEESQLELDADSIFYPRNDRDVVGGFIFWMKHLLHTSQSITNQSHGCTAHTVLSWTS